MGLDLNSFRGERGNPFDTGKMVSGNQIKTKVDTVNLKNAYNPSASINMYKPPTPPAPTPINNSVFGNGVKAPTSQTTPITTPPITTNTVSNTNIPDLRGYAQSKGYNVGYDPASDTVSISNADGTRGFNFKSGQGANYGISGDGTNSIVDITKFNTALGTNLYGINTDVNNKENQIQSNGDSDLSKGIDAIRAAINVNNLKQQAIIDKAPGQYTDVQHTADNQKAADLMAMREGMANKGISSSGASVNMETNIRDDFATKVNDIQLQRQKLIDDANMNIAQFMADGKVKEAQLIYDNAKDTSDKLLNESARVEELKFRKDQANIQGQQVTDTFNQGKDEFNKTYGLEKNKFSWSQEVDNRNWEIDKSKLNLEINADNRADKTFWMNAWETTGVADENIASKLGIPVGAITQTYKNMLLNDENSKAQLTISGGELSLAQDKFAFDKIVQTDAMAQGWAGLNIQSYNAHKPTGGGGTKEYKPPITTDGMIGHLKDMATTTDMAGNKTIDKNKVIQGLKSVSYMYNTDDIDGICASLNITNADLDNYTDPDRPKATYKGSTLDNNSGFMSPK